MNRKIKQSLIYFFTFILAASLCLPTAMAAKKKKAAKKASGPSAQEILLLKYEPVQKARQGKNPEFFIRGAFVDIQPAGGGTYNLSILPIEVVENAQRRITLTDFQSGLTIPIRLDKSTIKKLKKGNVVELNQYYKVIDQGGQGHARLVALSFFQELQPYPIPPTAYLKKPDLQPAQTINVLKSIEIYNGKLSGDTELKVALSNLAANSTDEQIKTKAQQLLVALFPGQ